MRVHCSGVRGFTLIEVIITVAIIAILLGLAAPSFGVWMQNQQIRAAAESVNSGLQLARATALNANVPVRFWFHDTAGARTGWTVCYWDVAGAECIDDPARYPDPVIQRKSSAEGTANVRIGATANAGTAATVNTALDPGAGFPEANGVTYGGLGRPVGPAATNFLRVDLRNAALSAADERRLVAAVSASGGIKICDPKLDPARHGQGC